MCWPWPEEDPFDLGQKIKGQVQIWTSNFKQFPHNNSYYGIFTYNDDTSHMCWPCPKEDLSFLKEDLYWFLG